MRVSTKALLLSIAVTLGCTYDASQLAAPEIIGAAGNSGQSLDAGEKPDVHLAGGNGGNNDHGGTYGTGGTLGAGGSGGTTSAGRSAVSGGITATGGQVVVGGLTSAGGALLAGATGGITPPNTGGAVSTGGTRSSTSTSTSSPPTSELAVYTKGITASSGTIGLNVRIDNRSAQPADMSSVTMRYWYQEEGLGSAIVIDSQYVSIGYSGQGKVTGAKVVPTSSKTKADNYLEFSMIGSLAAQGDKSSNDQFSIWVTVHNASYTGKVDVTNDYSYNSGAVGYNDKITLHSGGKVIWGTPPSSTGPPDGNPDAGVVPSTTVSAPPRRRSWIQGRV